MTTADPERIHQPSLAEDTYSHLQDSEITDLSGCLSGFPTWGIVQGRVMNELRRPLGVINRVREFACGLRDIVTFIGADPRPVDDTPVDPDKWGRTI